jgi:hypothetical protein
MKNISSKYMFLGLGIIVSLLAIYFVSAELVPRVLVTLTKAAPARKVSFGNSYVLGSKLLASADGKDTCVVNVFVLDDRSQGVMGKNVTIASKDGLQSVEGNTSLTDEKGKATLEASVDGVPMTQGVRVTFRN